MKKVAAIALLASVFAVPAIAQDQEYVMTCDEVMTKLNREATAEAKERFADFKGSCMGVVDRDGALFVHTKMVVRRVSGNTVTLYLPATDSTVRVRPDSNSRVMIEGRKVRPRNLSPRQELDLYVSVDRFTQPIPADEPMINEVMMLTEGDDLVAAPAEEVQAMPTTG